MARTKMTYLYCLDDHRNTADEIKKRFSDTSRYKVESFYSIEDFVVQFRKGLEPLSCKVAIIAIPEAKDKLDNYNDVTRELKRIDPGSGIILLVSQQLMDEIRKLIMYNIDDYIPISQNSVTRIHNAVKKIISENNITINRKFRNISFYILAAFVLISALGLLILYLKFPHLF